MRKVISRRPEPELVVVQDSTISNTIIVLLLIEGTILSTIESSVPDRRIMDFFLSYRIYPSLLEEGEIPQ